MMRATEYVLSERPFVVRRTVRWGDCDPAGVVYTGRFTDYLLGAVGLFTDHLAGGAAPGRGAWCGHAVQGDALRVHRHAVAGRCH